MNIEHIVLKAYPSKSEKGRHHHVILGKDGTIYCTCWQWKKKRWCKHLEDYHEGNIRRDDGVQGPTRTVPVRNNPQLTVVIAKEVEKIMKG